MTRNPDKPALLGCCSWAEFTVATEIQLLRWHSSIFSWVKCSQTRQKWHIWELKSSLFKAGTAQQGQHMLTWITFEHCSGWRSWAAWDLPEHATSASQHPLGWLLLDGAVLVTTIQPLIREIQTVTVKWKCSHWSASPSGLENRLNIDKISSGKWSLRTPEGSTSKKTHGHISSTKNPKLNLYTESRHSKDTYFVPNPAFFCKIKNALLEVFGQPQHHAHGSSKQQTCRKHLFYLNNLISFLFLLYSLRERVLVIGSKSHRHALSANWKSPGFLSVFPLCTAWSSVQLCVTVISLDLMHKRNCPASALANVAQHGLIVSSLPFFPKLELLRENTTRTKIFPFIRCPYPYEGKQAKILNDKEMLFDTLASTRW